MSFAYNQNITFCPLGVSALWCPSDYDVSTPSMLPPDAYALDFGRPANNWGWWVTPRPAGNWMEQHASYFGASGAVSGDGIFPEFSKTVYVTRIADITDGTSNTLSITECALFLLAKCCRGIPKILRVLSGMRNVLERSRVGYQFGFGWRPERVSCSR